MIVLNHLDTVKKIICNWEREFIIRRSLSSVRIMKLLLKYHDATLPYSTLEVRGKSPQSPSLEEKILGMCRYPLKSGKGL
jgi:hypothetical protein